MFTNKLQFLFIFKQLEETETRNMCHSYRDVITLPKREAKWENRRLGKRVANAAEVLCRTISRYEKCSRCSKPLRKGNQKIVFIILIALVFILSC